MTAATGAVVGVGSSGFFSASLTTIVGIVDASGIDGSALGLRRLKSLFSQYQRTRSLTQ